MSKQIYAAPDPTKTVIYKQIRLRGENRSHGGDTGDRGQLKVRRQKEEREEHIYESLDAVKTCGIIHGPQELQTENTARRQTQSEF